jgi:hypothetical protein
VEVADGVVVDADERIDVEEDVIVEEVTVDDGVAELEALEGEAELLVGHVRVATEGHAAA